MDQLERARGILEQAKSAYERGDMPVLFHYASRLMEAAQEANAPLLSAQAHYFLGMSEVYRGGGEGAFAHFDRALDGYRQAGDTEGVVRVLIGRGIIEAELNMDFAQSRVFLEAALETSLAAGSDRLSSLALANLGETARLEGDYASALRYAKLSLSLFERAGDQIHAAAALTSIAHYHALRREYAPSIDALRRAYTYMRKEGRFVDVARYLEIWFFVAFDVRRYEEASKILGFLEAYRYEHSLPRLPAMMPWYVPRIERLEQRLGYDVLAHLRREGELMTINQINTLTATIDS